MICEMERKLYTVKDVAHIANVTIKTLHHYDAIGLLRPAQVSAAGYRLYGQEELERLQQILFYRELDFPLKHITSLLQNGPDRKKMLLAQRALLLKRNLRLDKLLHTIDASIWHTEKGEMMDAKSMFNGFATEEEWKVALQEQDTYLKANYGTSITDGPINVQEMNEAAAEAKAFMETMASAVRNKVRHDDSGIQSAIKDHLAFLNAQGHTTTPKDFAALTRFFIGDDFHRLMMENQQPGLAYYIVAASEAFAAQQTEG